MVTFIWICNESDALEGNEGVKKYIFKWFYK